MRWVTRPWLIGTSLVAAGLLAISLGGADTQPSRINGATAADAGVNGRWAHQRAKEQGPPLALDITPTAGAKDLPITTEITTRVQHGTVSSITLTEQGGGQIAGVMRADGSSWMPSKPLKLGKTYTAHVTASGARGKTANRDVTFSTMAKANHRVTTSLNVQQGDSYGVAMPVVIEFDEQIPESARPGIERRLFVTSNPPQPGAWRWFADKQAIYRPASFWKPGTKLAVRAALDGLPLGQGRFGDKDAAATATIGRDLQMRVDNRTKQLSVYQYGKFVKNIPVSMGKPSTPSSSGTMVIMERAESTIFDTFAELGPAGYRVAVDYAQRLTWGGQFIHSAPWSVWAQGFENTSHGCINVSPANAKWLFDRTKVGDPITVRGTEHKLDPGDGWTAWNLSWADYLKGKWQ